MGSPQRWPASGIAVTGATGFLGTALVERLLRCVPEVELVLLIRAGRRRSPAARAQREILRNDVFDRLREELGDEGFAERCEQVTAIAGDVGRTGSGSTTTAGPSWPGATS